MKASLAVCLAALWLPSCTNEEAPVSTDAGNTYRAQVRMTASREMFDGTRSSLTDNGDGKLTPAWEVGDKVYVTTVIKDSQNESYAGTLEVVSTSNNGQSAEFTGLVEGAVYNGEKAYKFYFFGNNTAFEGPIAEKKYDFSSQNGLMPTLQDDDLLIGKANIKFTDGAGTVNVPFQRQFSYAHYKLVYDGQELATKGVEISISADNLAATASVDFATASITSGAVAPIKVTPAESNDFYVALVPNYEETTLTFTCQVDGVNFIGTRKLSNNKNNKFYRSNEEGHGAIPIVMTPVKQYRVIYNIKVTGIDDNDPRVCASVPYTVSNPEAYEVLNFTSVKRNTSATQEKDADFVAGYFADFLGWGTEKNMNTTWPMENYGAEYLAKENDEDQSPESNGTINFTSLPEGKVVYNEKTGTYDLNLYAKGTFIMYTLILDLSKYNQSSSDEYRPTGWIDYKISYDHPIEKTGFEFLGFTRRDKNGNNVDGDVDNPDNLFQVGDYVHIVKNDPYGEWKPDVINGLDEDKNTGIYKYPSWGQQIVKLYPVWKKIENGTIDITNYGTGSLE